MLIITAEIVCDNNYLKKQKINVIEIDKEKKNNIKSLSVLMQCFLHKTIIKFENTGSLTAC